MPRKSELILVTGATGYLGGRLVPWLLDAGYRVRCLARNRRKLAARPWSDDPRVEMVEGDAGSETDVRAAMDGCQIAYYLIHSMMAVGEEYREQDRQLAQTFARAAAASGLERIIYLGGLGETGEGLSEHLSSRREVEHDLAAGPVPVTVLRAAVILGSGSSSFEILRYLVHRLPVMLTPRWVRTECQPIAVRNVLQYLVACLETPATTGRTLEIGGPEVVNYQELMRIVAQELGLPRRIIIPIPLLTPRLSSLWIHLVTPLSRRIARPLAEGLRNRVVVRDDAAQRLMPLRLLGVREAISLAVGRMTANDIATSWSDAGVIPGDPDWSGGTLFEDPHTGAVAAPPEEVFAAVCRLGGTRGYHSGTWLWQLRGWLDRLIGGPGLRRGRRDPEHLVYGDALDFWRVARVETPTCLELRAEMRLPGVAVLAFAMEPDSAPDTSRLQMTARFQPRGLLGLLYWYCVLPLHKVVFSGMLAGIQQDAEASWQVRQRLPSTVKEGSSEPLPDASAGRASDSRLR